MGVKKWSYVPEKIYLECSKGEQPNSDGAVDQGGKRFELLLWKPCRGELCRGPIPRKARADTKIWWTSKNRPKINFLVGEIFFSPHNINLGAGYFSELRLSPCLHNRNEVDEWMRLDEWNSWFISQVRDSHTQTSARYCEFKQI
ncbi:hypothetical protein TNCV_3820261 [Trichonephila clavipes]|uniref:Uncharacterized protein n=1 Tax=Trichonephila clavipes TaxID=2585209 RepID=A0A8X6R2R4_TRICX|nr:hypothetical protein TNCV_3820261 [Trichonephila clavipes]